MEKRKFYVEYRLVAFLVLLISLILFSGIYIYSNLRTVLGHIEQDEQKSEKLELLRELKAELSLTESYSNAYIITEEIDYLAKYLRSAEHVTDFAFELDSVYSNAYKQELTELKEEIENRNILMDSIIQMENDSDGKFLSVLDAEVDSLDVESQNSQQKPKFFKRLFKRNAESNDPDTSVVKGLVQRIENYSSKASERLKNQTQRYITLSDQIIVKGQSIREKIENLEQSELQATVIGNEKAEKTAGATNQMVVIYSILIILLVTLAGFTIFNYIRNEKKHRQQLLEAKRNTEELALSKQNFFASMNHELRTPLHAIRGFAEELLESDISPEQEKKAVVIHKSAGNLIHLVNDLLDQAKMASGKFDFKPERVETRKLLNEIVDLLEPLKKQNNNTLKLIVETEVPEFLLLDPIRLQQVLFNITGNAMKFTEDGSISIKTSYEADEVKFEVRDTGKGMTRAELDHMFEEFEQYSSNNNIQGSGLGLGISKNIIEMQGGKISAESEPGKGTCFYFSLPAKKMNEREESKKTLETIRYDLKGKRVLIADDEEYNRKLLRLILEKEGVEIKEAENGKEAIEQVKNNSFDFVLMDNRMPLMRGEEAIVEIRKFQPSLPIFVVSASLGEEEKVQFKQAGFSGHLLKPFSKAELHTLLGEHLDLKVKISDPKELKEKKKSPKNTFNLQSLIDISHNDPKVLEDMVETFIRTSEAGLEAMNEAFHKEDWQELSNQAHKISAPCHHIEANELYSLLKKIENEENPSKKETLKTLIKIENYMRSIIEALKELRLE